MDKITRSALLRDGVAFGALALFAGCEPAAVGVVGRAAAAMLDPKSTTAAHVPQEQRVAIVRRLRDGAKRAFMEAYRKKAADSGSAELLDFFLIEKAAYELAYEAANRPAWVSIPIRGLARLTARVLPARSGR